MSKTRNKAFSFIKFLLSIAVYYGIFTFATNWWQDRNEAKEAAKAEVELTARLPSAPAELRSNLFLSTRSAGTCHELIGDVLMTVIFVDDAEGSWTATEMEEIKTQHLEVTEKMQAQAAEYGVDLDLSYQYLHASSDVTFSRDDSSPWVESALADLGLSGLAAISYDLKADYNVQEAPLLLYTHQHGRSFALQQSHSLSAEYAVLFQNLTDYRHELYHLFGAEDFYYPEEVTALAEQYLPNSIMMNSDSGEVDDLTAYLIGWTDELSENALQFLEATNHLTQTDLIEAHAEETYTGYGTKEYDSGTYTGDLVDGFCHGIGTFEWADGNIYEGEWVHGSQTGYGTFTWANGSVYEGDWIDGVQTGYGTLSWANGNVYAGDWVDGTMHGKGTLTWAEGDVYAGEWVEGIRSGYGTYYWPNGDVYDGEWIDGVRTGQGTLTFADGTVWSGYWEDNEFIG